MTAKHWRLERDGTFRETEPGRGTWVYHADHKRETAQMQARVAELEAALRQAARLEQTDRGGLGLHLAGWAE